MIRALEWAATAAAFVLVLALTVGAVRSETATSITDGDTFRIGDERIRIRTIDTPEIMRPRCKAERRLAIEAKVALRELIEGRDVEIVRHGKDGFGRTLADVIVDGQDVGETLVARGLALPWRDGIAARAVRVLKWCGRPE
jgi:micrococcal nuclease